MLVHRPSVDKACGPNAKGLDRAGVDIEFDHFAVAFSRHNWLLQRAGFER
jgi:hypothetical protein